MDGQRTYGDEIFAEACTTGLKISPFFVMELPRMTTVVRNFALYRWIEIALLLAGAAAFVAAARGSALRGAGAGLSLQAALMLVLDLFAERRAQVYLGARGLSGIDAQRFSASRSAIQPSTARSSTGSGTEPWSSTTR